MEDAGGPEKLQHEKIIHLLKIVGVLILSVIFTRCCTYIGDYEEYCIFAADSSGQLSSVATIISAFNAIARTSPRSVNERNSCAPGEPNPARPFRLGGGRCNPQGIPY